MSPPCCKYGSGLKRLSATSSNTALMASPLGSVSVVRGYVIAVRALSSSIVSLAPRASVQIQHRQELAVASGVRHHGRAARVADDDRTRHRIVRVPAQNRVDAAHAPGELQIDVHTVVRQQDHDLRT